MPRKFRLKGKRAFEEFRRSGEVYYSHGIVLKTIRGRCGRKFAFIVTKRIGNAVRRNRTRRVLSEWVRLHLDLFPDGARYLMIVRSPAIPETELVRDLGDLAGKVPLGK